MAEDPSLAEAVTARTAAGATAERALYEAFGQFRAMLAEAGEYLAARVADLDDLAARAVAAAAGRPMPGVPEREEPFVLVAGTSRRPTPRCST
jgi:phosphotransferase system enzyme I (PtsI)